MCPILSFLGRTTTTWTPPITLGIGLMVCLASFLNAVILCLDEETTVAVELTQAQAVIMVISASCYVVVCCYTAWRTCRPQWCGGSGTGGDAGLDRSASVGVGGGSSDSLQTKDSQAAERFRNSVIAFHMLSTLVSLVTNIYWLWFSFRLSPMQLSVLIYVMVAAGSLVFVIEGRVRKNEMTRALFALITGWLVVSYFVGWLVGWLVG